MNSMVQRLRHWHDEYGDKYAEGRDCKEAADRIEQLEAALRHIEVLDIRCTIDDAADIARRALEGK
jgi:hypothetical protein